MSDFIQTTPTLDAYWRAIILFGKNSASYKFALAKSLFEIYETGKTFVTLDELAEPFARNILDHLSKVERQGTFKSSTFLNFLTQFQRGEISQNKMIEQTAQLGFVNVIDAFHIVNQNEIPIRFFIDERKNKNGITLTDNLSALRETIQSQNLPYEVEARWRLVETSWQIGISSGLLTVKYDDSNNLLFVEEAKLRRINVTSSIDALNGYQKGKCFYCYKDISVKDCDVDHFFPFILISRSDYFSHMNMNGVWNLVLSCKECNRGARGKFARVPEVKYIERLNQRNNYLIESNHPLRETLINQTGISGILRRDFLKQVDARAIQYLIHRWTSDYELDPAF
jgi:hypothetical protein